MTLREMIQINNPNKIASLYPSCKFTIVCLYALCSLILGSITVNGYAFWLIPWGLVVPLLCVASGVASQYIKALKKLGFFVALIFIVQALLVPMGEVIASFWIFKIHDEGLQNAMALSLSILNIAGIFTWFFQTTENKEISAALENAGVNHKTTYVFISSLQMIDVLGKSSKTIMNAQRARGVETEGNVIVRAKAFFPSLVPLILGAITNTEERVLTLESKGFDVRCQKTRLFQLRKNGYEKQAVVIAIAVTVVICVWRVLAWVL